MGARRRSTYGMIVESLADLRDTAGLRFARRANKAKRAAAPPAPCASTQDEAAASSSDDGELHPFAFERRRRLLELWADASGTEATFHTCERTACDATLLAIDAEQIHIHVEGLQTPMGTYPCATLRSADLLFAELGAGWSTASPLPDMPDWVHDERTVLSPVARVTCVGGATAAPSDGSSLEATAAIADPMHGPSFVGESVELVGLSREGLNGKVGKAVAFNEEKARVGVQLAGAKLPLAIKPANLRLASSSRDADAEAGEAGEADEAGGSGAVASKANEKYFLQRYMLFSRYDEGVRLDEEGWYSVTPEVLAAHIASRCACDLMVDAFTGVGGNAIQFAFSCERVIAIDLDAARLDIARHNAAVYGVADRVQWIHGDFFALAPSLKADVIFLSPPWGGPGYAEAEIFDMRTMMGGLDGAQILRDALGAAPNVAYFLPRNTDRAQVAQLAREAGVPLEIEVCKLNGHVKGLMAYFGFSEEEEEEEGGGGEGGA